MSLTKKKLITNICMYRFLKNPCGKFVVDPIPIKSLLYDCFDPQKKAAIRSSIHTCFDMHKVRMWVRLSERTNENNSMCKGTVGPI